MQAARQLGKIAMSTTTFSPSSLFDLSGRVALVTGGATGIGLMQSQGLAAAGAKVYITGRRQEALDNAAKLYSTPKASLIPLQGDVTDKQDILRLVKELEQREGKLDILINNAGSPGPTHPGSNTADASGAAKPSDDKKLSVEEYSKQVFESQEPSDWDNLFHINVQAPFFVSIAFLPLLAKGSQSEKGWSSTIITTGSISGVVKQSQKHVAYNASKAAANHITKLLAFEVSASTTARIRVNGIAPGVFPSQMTGSGAGEDNKTDLGDKKMDVPAGRPGTDHEMAALTVFLATSTYTNGQVIAIDGGFTLTQP